MFKFVATVALAAGLVVLIPTAAEAKPPAACVQALKAAERYQTFMLVAVGLRQDTIEEMLDELTTAPTPAGGLNGVTRVINEFTPKMVDVNNTEAGLKADYQKAAKRCRAGK